MSNTKKTTLIRWIAGAVFALLTLGSGFHYSSLFLLCAAFLMLPFKFTSSFFEKRNIKPVIVIILSVVLLFVGIFTSPLTSDGTQGDDSNQSQNDKDDEDDKKENDTQNPNDKNNNSDKDNSDKNDTSNPSDKNDNSDKDSNTDNTNSDKSDSGDGEEGEEKTEVVWVSGNGTKYHSTPNCSNMKSPRELTIEEAERQNYTPCSKCH